MYTEDRTRKWVRVSNQSNVRLSSWSMVWQRWFRMTGVQQQQDVRPEADFGLNRSAVVVEELLAFRWAEVDTGHGAPLSRVGGTPHQAPKPSRRRRRRLNCTS